MGLAAPGVGILSTLPGNRYGSYSGTSMATPHVAGVAALIKSRHPTFDDGQLKDRILEVVYAKTSLQGQVATGGRLNAHASLLQTAPPDSTRPTIASVRPQPSTRDRTPTLTATVRDDRAELTRDNIRFSLDGRQRDAFTYGVGSTV